MPTGNICRPFRGLDRLMIEVYFHHQSLGHLPSEVLAPP